MAYYATFLNQIVTMLRERGVDADLEYPRKSLSVHASGRYLTIGLESAEYQPALAYRDGLAFPVTLHLRLRMHQNPTKNVQALSALYEAVVLPAFVDAGYDLRSMKLHSPEYDRSLDRMVMRADCMLHGYVVKTVSAAETEREEV